VVRAGVLALAISLTIVGCTSTGSGEVPVARPAAAQGAPGDVPSATDSVAWLRALPFTEATVDRFAEVLRASGVDVVADMSSSSTAAVRVTRWQVENMAVEAANGGGISGRTLAALAPTADGVPPMPFLIAAWMLQAETPAARFARDLQGSELGDDAYALIFPAAALTLFLADATGSQAAPPTPGDSTAAAGAALSGEAVFSPAVLTVDALDAPCTAASAFIQNAIAAVAKALTIRTSGSGFFGFMASIWNTAVRLASAFVSGLVKNLTAGLLARLVGVFNAIAAVEQISSVLIAWRAPLEALPASNRFGVGSEHVTGDITMQLQPHVLPVPAAVKDCAQSVGVDISATAAGSRVRWTTTPSPRPDLATTLTSAASLDAKESATMRYQTGQDPEDSLDDPEQVGTLAVAATIRRNDVERVRQLIAELLLAQVPVSLRSLVESLARPILDAATGKLAELTDVRSRAQVPVTYHLVSERCKPSRIAPGTYEGSIDTDLRNGAATGHMVGSVTIVVAPDKSISGQMTVETDASAPGMKKTHSVERVTISGSTTKPIATLEKRTIDGKDATFPQSGATRPMTGLCPPGLTWDTGPLSPGTKVPNSGSLMVTATRVG
jgi:hypothetical protein